MIKTHFRFLVLYLKSASQGFTLLVYKLLNINQFHFNLNSEALTINILKLNLRILGYTQTTYLFGVSIFSFYRFSFANLSFVNLSFFVSFLRFL